YLHVQLGHARDVAAWPIEASDETELHRIAGGGEDNGNRRNRGFYRLHSRAIGDDHCHLTTNQLSRQRRHSVVLPARPAILDRYVLTLDIACFLQALTKRAHHRRVCVRRCAVKKSDHRHRRRLRACRHRPRRNRAAKQRDELAALHSITSSARTINVIGTWSPIALAALRLRISSNFVGCSTGRLEGLAPRRILS